MENVQKHSSERIAGREHFPVYPKGFIAVRIVQLVLAVICLGLCAYGVTLFAFSGDSLMLFTAVVTMISVIYYIVAEYGAPALYNYWAVLALDTFLVVFWLISFALLAAQVAPAFAGYTYCSSYSGSCYTSRLSGEELVYVSCLAAAAGLGALEFVLFIVSLAIHSIRLHRHRAAGLHCMPGQSATPVAGAGAVGAEKVAPQAQTQQLYPQQTGASQSFVQQPQAVYPAQHTPPPQHMYAASPQQQQQQQHVYAQQSPQQVPQQYPQQYPQQIPQPYPQQYAPQAPQQTASPLLAQQTGASYVSQPSHMSTTQHELEPIAPNQGPYEAPAQSVQHPHPQ